MYATDRRQTSSDVRRASSLNASALSERRHNKRTNTIKCASYNFQNYANLTTNKFTICCCPAWSLLCLFRTPPTHRSAYSLCTSSHRRVLEYSLSYSSSTRVTNYSVSAALLNSDHYHVKIRDAPTSFTGIAV